MPAYKPRTATAASTMPKLNYNKRTYEQMSALADQRGSGRNSYITNDVKFYKSKDGDNRVRILPATWDNAEHWGCDIWLHYGIGADNDAYLCPAKHNHGDGRCPICEAAAQTEVKEEQAVLKPKHRIGVYLVSREKQEEGVVFWAMPFNLDRDFISACLDKFTREFYPADDIKQGFDHVFVRTGQADRTRYSSVQISRNPSPLHTDPTTAAIWSKYIQDKPIPNILKFYEYDFIKRAFYGSGNESEPEPAPVTSRVAAASTVVAPTPAPTGSQQFTAAEQQADPLTVDAPYPQSPEVVYSLSFEDAASLADALHVNLEQIEDETQLREAICKALNLAAPAATDQSVADKLRERFSKLKK